MSRMREVGAAAQSKVNRLDLMHPDRIGRGFKSLRNPASDIATISAPELRTKCISAGAEGVGKDRVIWHMYNRIAIQTSYRVQ